MSTVYTRDHSVVCSSSCGAETSVEPDPPVGLSKLFRRLIFTFPNPDYEVVYDHLQRTEYGPLQ